MSVAKLTGTVLFLALLAIPRPGSAGEAVYAVEVVEAEVVQVEIPVEEPAFALKGDPDEEVIEIDPDEMTIDGQPPRPGLWELCREAAAGERGERLVCATRVGDDSLQLVLGGSPEETLWTVAVETFGKAGDGGGFRLVEGLEPGSYVVRVAGRGGAALRLTASVW